MHDFVVFLLEEGVLGLANEIPGGIDCVYFVDGVEFQSTFDITEFKIIIEV